ncbi:E3 ubiquitin-protein ligase DTX4 isoform X2 [Patella vulgata]|uniref:E3 ubiquitin-protein ligase DTX4 isoform X2 n=2 Tax=Patella vulgata TaxID=6465 RepID=UPI0021803BE5|nr:E3 ubiquitin-protein ligase DTX4 isoform X2 [Patella vulgata]
MMNLKSHGSKISPVVSNITNVLTSPIVPGAFSHQSVSLHGNFQPSAYSLPTPSPQTSTFSAKGHIVLPKLKKSKGKSGADMPHQYFKAVLKPSDDEDCCICCEKLNSESDYGKSNHAEGEVVSLSLCAHTFHRQCLRAMYDSGPKDGSLQCPNCKKIHGFKHGICPAGEMHFWTIPESLPGYEGCCTICVKYFIRPGTQGHEHPNPGRKFSARGFPRIGYLPDNDKGRKVLQLFTIAWQRRVMFTIGSSSTTGETDTVTWNEIHHKTEFGSNESGHGYPDPNYLDNVLLELAIQGVTEDDLTSTGI